MIQGLAPPVGEPNGRGCMANYHSPFCECPPANVANRLILAAKELLQAVNCEPIRAAALANQIPLYERSAALIDAIDATERAMTEFQA